MSDFVSDFVSWFVGRCGCFRSLGQISALFELLHSCAKIINYLFTFSFFFSFSDQGAK